MRRPSCASTMASSTSGTSVTHTGQPGPMITFRSRGNTLRRPNLAIACSWLPHTCITETGARPISATTRSSAPASARAFAGSRNRSSRAPSVITVSGMVALPLAAGGDLASHVRGHHVRLRLLQEQLVQRQRLLDLVCRDLADREPDVIQDVVARTDRLVDDIEACLTPHAEEIHGRRLPVDGHDPPWYTQTHDALLRFPGAAADGRGASGLEPLFENVPHEDRCRVEDFFLRL